jgi:invasion protein IalB
MRLHRLQLAALLLPIAAALAQPNNALAQPKPASTDPGSQATLLGQFADWGAYTATPGGRKVCFALSKPTASSEVPPNRRSEANVVYLFVSTRPEERVRDEVSMLITGYEFRPNSDATIAIGGASFAMYTQNDGAWVKNAAEETKLVEALRKGADTEIKAVTSKGTRTSDTFSLRGISQALDRVAQECK